jgi:NADH-quinone oxidoreductase subunit E
MVAETEKEIKFSPEALALVKKYRAKFPEGKHKSALLSVLHLAQVEFGGWLSPQVMDYVAEILELKPIEVYEVATFYSMYFTHPMGKYVFEVCHTGPCQICGSDEIIEYLENKLGIKEGQTTPDGMFSIKAVECLAACGGAPMMQVGLKYHENLTHEKLDGIIDECRVENKVSRVSV